MEHRIFFTVWKCSCNFFLKCFSLKNILKWYFFIFKKIFLILAHQNNLRTPKNINFKKIKINFLIFFLNTKINKHILARSFCTCCVLWYPFCTSFSTCMVEKVSSCKSNLGLDPKFDYYLWFWLRIFTFRWIFHEQKDAIDS